jgi:hypothetical protein
MQEDVMMALIKNNALPQSKIVELVVSAFDVGQAEGA